MNKQTFDERFENEVLPHIAEQFEQDGFIDIPARQFAYNHEKDVLCKNNEITAKQYHDWIIPDKFVSKESNNAFLINFRKEVVEVEPVTSPSTEPNRIYAGTKVLREYEGEENTSKIFPTYHNDWNNFMRVYKKYCDEIDIFRKPHSATQGDVLEIDVHCAVRDFNNKAAFLNLVKCVEWLNDHKLKNK